MEKNRIRNSVHRAKVIWTSEITGVSTNHVDKVIRGDRTNDEVLTAFMEIQERLPSLLEEVKRIVPPVGSSKSKNL